MKLLVLDGNSILNRAFYGIRLLTTKNGEYTNAVYGFINILNKLISSEEPDAVCAAFDLKAPTFRHKMYTEYKAGRKPMPQELVPQFPLIKEYLTLSGYTVIEKEGYEADDILGTLARLSEESKNECVIATGDRDSLQLVSEKVSVILATTKAGSPETVKYTPEKVYEKYGLYPESLVDLKAVQGDTSDNIPGVPGIGEKGATDLIKAFGNIDYIYENLETLDIKEGIRKKLADGKESAYLSRKLGRICKEVPLSENISDYKAKERSPLLAGFMTRLELFSIMKNMGISPAFASPVSDGGIKTEEKKFTEVSPEEFKAEDRLYLTLSDNGVGAVSGDSVTFFPLGGMFDSFDLLKPLLESDCEKSIYDCKNFVKFCKTNGIELSNVKFDTVLAAYLLNPSASDYSSDRLSAEYLKTSPVTESDKKEIKEAVINSLLCDSMKVLLEEKGQTSLLSDIEIPLAFVLADMELTGFSVDTAGLISYGNKLGEEIEKIKSEIFGYIGHEFNLNSPKQLGVALFEELGLPSGKKTKSGYSTNAEVLENLRHTHPAVELLLSYRQKTKLKSTYCDALAAAVSFDGRIHSTFNQTETRTGRISSLEPNLQNIPVRQTEGKELRKYFRAKEGYSLCDADYSQIELRVLASMSNDKNMISAFESGTDIHTVTASKAFSMPIEMVTPTLRSRAKAVNFGIVYGIGAFSLSKDIGVSVKEAKEYINGYLAAYPEIDGYMTKTIENAKKDGFVTTLFGRRRYIPEITAQNKMLVSFGERVARNAPIQGTAADIIKIAMIRVSERIKKENLDASLILQVHDELIVECREGLEEKICGILREEMGKSAKLKVELSVDAAYGKTWYEAKK